MTAIAIQRMSSSANVGWLQYLSTLWAVIVCMSKTSDKKKRWEDRELSPNERFDAFLEGYLMSFDMHPVCDRPLYVKKDIHQILQAFWVVAEELNRGVQELIDSPDQVPSSVEIDDVKKRRVQAAQRALAAIRRARIDRPSES